MKLSRPWSLVVLLLAAAAAHAADAALAPAIQLFENGRFAEAQKAFAAWAAAHPKDADGAYWNGRALYALRKTDDAIAQLEKATELAPRRSDVFLAYARAEARAAQEASLLGKAGHAKRAHAAWDQAVALDPDNLDARADLIQFHLLAPGFMGGDVEEARRQATEIAKRDAVRGALARVTIAQQHDKDLPAAGRILVDTLAKHPGDLQLRRALGLLYQLEEKWDAAFGIYDAMLAENPDAYDALYQVGRAAALSGKRLDQGAAALRRYVAHPPKPEEPPLANAHYRLGMVLEKKGDKAGAKAAYQAAVKLDPKLEDARKALAALG